MKKHYLLCLLAISACSYKKEQKVQNNSEKVELLNVINQTSSEDEVLHPEVSEFINNRQDRKWQDNAYVYLWGMEYKPNDVYQTGLEIAQQLAKLNEQHDYKSEYEDGFLDQHQKIKIPNFDDFCSFLVKGCFNEIVENIGDKLILANQFRNLRKRYSEFMSFASYSDVSGWVLDDNFTMPPYNALIRGMKLNHVFWIEKLKNDVQEPNIAQLALEASNLKRLLAQADNIIAKERFVHMYAEHLELLNSAYSMGWLNAEQVRKLPSLVLLEGDELSTEKAWLNEEKVKLILIKKTFNAEQIDDVFIDLFYPELPAKMVKPNAILNKLYFDLMKPMIAYMDQSPQAFSQGLKDFDIKIEFDEVENAAGALLNASSEDIKNRYLDFQAVVFSLNMKIQLLNAILEQGSAEQVIKKAQQGHIPYLNHYDQSPPYIDSGQICYSGILELDSRYRCLNLISSK